MGGDRQVVTERKTDREGVLEEWRGEGWPKKERSFIKRERMGIERDAEEGYSTHRERENRGRGKQTEKEKRCDHIPF